MAWTLPSRNIVGAIMTVTWGDAVRDSITAIGINGHTGVSGDGATLAHSSFSGQGVNDHHARDHASTHQPSGADTMAVGATAGTGSLRTIGTGALELAAGNHTH